MTTLSRHGDTDPSPPQVEFGPNMADVPNPFRNPALSVLHRRSQDVLSLERRGVLAPAWGCSLSRARPFFDLKRWFPSRPES